MALSAAQQQLFNFYQSVPASARASSDQGAQDPAAIARHIATLTDDEALGSLAAITGQANGSTFRPDSVSTTAATPERRSWSGSPDNWIAYRADGTTYGPGTVKAQGAQTMQTTQAPTYTADQIKAYADNILGQGGSYQDVANAAQKFGVPLNDVFSAYGMDAAQGQQFMQQQGINAPGASPAVSNAQVADWYSRNSGLSDPEIAQYMNNYGVSSAQLADSIGLPNGSGYTTVRDRFNAATGGTGASDADVSYYLRANQGAGDAQIRGAMDAYGVGTDQMARVSGLPTAQVQARYAAAGSTPTPLPGIGGPSSGSTPTPLPGIGGAPTVPPPLGQGPGSGTMPLNQPPIGTPDDPYGLGGGSTPANPYGTGQGTFSQMYGGYQASPWLSATADELGRRTQQALGQAFNSIRSNAIGVGGRGGSRQGVAEGMATSNAMDSLQGNLANLFGQDWTQAQNRGLQARGQDQGFTVGIGGLANQRAGMNMNYDLGIGQQALTGRAQDMGFYGQQRGQDLQQLGLGAQIYDAGVRGDWAPLTTAGGLFNTTAGNSVTQTNGGTQGGGWQGLLGGALGAGQFARNQGWW